MAKKAVLEAEVSPFGEVVMVFTKSVAHGIGLLTPKITTTEGIKFLEGIQSTGKDRHRMEKKRTLIPLDHIASIVEFATEDDLWSEPQPKHIPAQDPDSQSALLTSHEGPGQHPRPHNPNHRPHHRGGPRNGPREGGRNKFRGPRDNFDRRNDMRPRRDNDR